jgi:hypothetical protein
LVDTKDIIERIHLDFGSRSPEAIKILNEGILKADYLNSNRIIRCILFLANGDFEKLKKHVGNAIYDPRDVMLRAEYINIEHSNPKRIRDFNKTFEKSEDNVQQ